jgi:cyclase
MKSLPSKPNHYRLAKRTLAGSDRRRPDGNVSSSSPHRVARFVPLLRVCFATIVLMTASPAHAQSATTADSSNVFHTTRVTKRIALLSGPDANVLLYSSDSMLVLVDAGEATTAHSLALAVQSISDLPVRLVIVTHYHSDHLGGVGWWRTAAATILAHETVPNEALKDTVIPELHWHRTPTSVDALPTQTFRDSLTLRAGDEQISVIHLDSAHTNGDAIVWFHESNLIDTGDILSTPPGIDLSAGGSIDGMIRAFDRIISMAGPETRIVPGHGPVTDRGHLIAYRSMLEALRARVDSGISRGWSLKELQDSSPAAGYEALLGGPRIGPQLVQLLYRERQQESRRKRQTGCVDCPRSLRSPTV